MKKTVSGKNYCPENAGIYVFFHAPPLSIVPKVFKFSLITQYTRSVPH
jgi:hypothetical protein